jgi:hypothetical protein
LSHLEVIARGRLRRQLASRGIDRGSQARHRGSFCFYPTFYPSRDCKSRRHQSWTPIPTPIQVFAVVALLRSALFLQSLPLLTRAIRSMSEALWASNSSSLIILPILWPGRRYLESDTTAESDKGPITVVGIDIGAVVTARRRSYSRSTNMPAAQRVTLFDIQEISIISTLGRMR